MPERKISSGFAVVGHAFEDVTERQHREVVFEVRRRKICARIGCNKVLAYTVNIALKALFVNVRVGASGLEVF